jgi:hypothetical protein
MNHPTQKILASSLFMAIVLFAFSIFIQEGVADPMTCPDVCVCIGMSCPAPPSSVDCGACSAEEEQEGREIWGPARSPGSGDESSPPVEDILPNPIFCAAVINLPKFDPEDPTSWPGVENPIPNPIMLPASSGPGLGNPNITTGGCYTCCNALFLGENENLTCMDCCDDFNGCLLEM